MKYSIITLALLTLATYTAQADLPAASTKTNVTYAVDIKPILDASCIKCHSEGQKPKAGISLNSLAAIQRGGKHGQFLVVGNSAKSDIVASIAHTGNPDTFMPKGPGAKKLTPEQIGLVRAWIDQGCK